MRAFLGVLALLAFAGCAHVKNKDDVCPEYRELSCASGVECAYDSVRKCEVCRCEDATSANPVPTDPALPPEKREPEDPIE